ncbi:hypothetical protein VQ643_14955 [Pseudomonas sp. F1_0610]|uniref:O-antigen ligase family protein n=1 Tax=Pseudomonas sp. F1_0610 TaxID=3114284 RepID=UPI0039C46A91
MLLKQHSRLDKKIVLQILCAFLWISLFIFVNGYFLDLTNKTINNFFYVGIGFLGLLTLFLFYREDKEVVFSLLLFLLPMLALSLMEWELSGYKIPIYLCLFLVGCFVFSKNKFFKSVYLASFLLAFCISVYIIFDWFLIWGETGKFIRYANWLGEYYHPGFFSMLLCFIFLMFFDQYFLNKIDKNKSILVFLAVFIFFAYVAFLGVIFQSRTALLGVLAYFIGFAIYKKTYLYFFVIFLIVCAALYFTEIGDLVANRGASHRTVIWKEVWFDYINNCNYFVGCAPMKNILGQFAHPHNIYLSILHNTGIIGAILFLLFFTPLIYMIFKYKPQWGLLVFYALPTILTESETLFAGNSELWVYFWLPILMCMVGLQRPIFEQYKLAKAKLLS